MLAKEFMVFLKSAVAQSIFYEAGLDGVNCLSGVS
jgi:hypothetical protein